MKKILKLIINSLIISSIFIPNINSNDFTTNNLKKHLLENYYHNEIPIIDNKPINLSLGIAIRAFNNIDQIDGTSTLNLWLRYNWHDIYNWDPNSFGNISGISFNTDPQLENHIWTPDIYLYNTAEKPMEQLDFSKAEISYDGTMFWSRPGLLKSTCLFDLTDFPFDTQTCVLKFGSWSYDSSKINLSIDKNTIDLSNFRKHNEWDLVNYSVTKNSVKYVCCEHEYHDIEFFYTIKRKSGYYNLNIIIPTFSTATLILLTLIIPFESGERISFAVTILLSIIVFLLILSDNLPKSEDKPLLSIMIIGLVYFSLVGVVFTIIMSNFNVYIEKKKYEEINYKNNIIEYILKKFNIKDKKKQDISITHDISITQDDGNEYGANASANASAGAGVNESINNRSNSYINIINRLNNINETINMSNNINKNIHLSYTNDTNGPNDTNEKKSNISEYQIETLLFYIENIYTLLFIISFIVYSFIIFKIV
jgi:hypothetical protein